MYTKTTQGIKITAVPQFLEDQSEPKGNRFVWAYTIYMENQGTQTVRLLNRYWHITDGKGRSQEVRGPGVVGEHPILKPGQAFRYTSGVPLPTPSGIMVGEYEMIVPETGETILVAVPAFALESPFAISRPN
jgi:ApaG protein